MNDSKNKIVELDLNDILPNRFQPRIVFNEDSIVALSESIKEHGVLQAIIVRPIGDKYEIIAGERRYKASVLAGLKTIPSIILDLNDKDSAEIALIENVQRRDLTPIEEAISIKKILDMGYITQEQLAEKLGKSQSAIANKIRLLNLCDEVQEALMDGKISERHARSLLKISTSSDQRKMLNKIIKERLTVRKLDTEIDKFLETGIIDENIEDIQEEKKIEKLDLNIENNKETDSLPEIVPDEKVELQTNESLQETSSEIKINNDSLEENLKSLDEKEDEMETSKDNETAEKIDEDVPVLDLSDLFITLENNNKIIDEEKKEEGDNMNNNTNGGSFFNFGFNEEKETNNDTNEINQQPLFQFNNAESDESNDFMKEKMKDLMAPQGSTPSFQTKNSITQDSIFVNGEMTNSNETVDIKPEENSIEIGNTPNSSTENKESSMFSSLMNNSNGTEEAIDSKSLNQFLNPRFIDGEVQNKDSVEENLDTSVFAKFINPEVNTGRENNDIKTDTQNVSSSTDTINIFNRPLESNIQNFNASKSDSADNNNESVINSQNIFNSSPLSMNSSSIENVSPEVASPAIEASTISNNDTLFTPTLENANNSLEAPVANNSSIVNSEESKPDLLAPMSQEIETPSIPEKKDIFAPFANIFAPKNEEVNEEKNIDSLPSDDIKEEQSNSFENISHQPTPVFVTATSEENDSIPTTPIIDNPQKSMLLANNNEEFGPSIQNNNITEESEANNALEEDSTINESSNLNVQPIIVTDYNKQYDPVLPIDKTKIGPQVEFKQVLNLIRNLNDQIEALGYTIDTDEIDLDDKYQVIFNIMKK